MILICVNDLRFLNKKSKLNAHHLMNATIYLDVKSVKRWTARSRVQNWLKSKQLKTFALVSPEKSKLKKKSVRSLSANPINYSAKRLQSCASEKEIFKCFKLPIASVIYHSVIARFHCALFEYLNFWQWFSTQPPIFPLLEVKCPEESSTTMWLIVSCTVRKTVRASKMLDTFISSWTDDLHKVFFSVHRSKIESSLVSNIDVDGVFERRNYYAKYILTWTLFQMLFRGQSFNDELLLKLNAISNASVK